MVALSEVLRPSSDPIAVKASASYPNLGILNFGRGVFKKPDIEGMKTSATTLYRVRAGQFIYSRLFAFEGAFALVPSELDGHFVSNEFPTFDIDVSTVTPGYIGWVFRQPHVWTMAASFGVGMGDRRRRVHPEALIKLSVPLPSIGEQKLIVTRLDSVAERVAKRAAAVKHVKAELGAMLHAEFCRITLSTPTVRFGEVAPLTRRPVTTEPGAIYREIGARAFGRGLFKKPDVQADKLTWQQLFRIEQGDLVFSNIKAWEGAFAVADTAHHGCVGSHRYLTCVPDQNRATAEFLWFYLQSAGGIAAVQAASPGSADRNRTLSSRALADIRVPLPSLEAQESFNTLQTKVVAAVEAQREAALELDKLLPALLYEAFVEGPVATTRAAA